MSTVAEELRALVGAFSNRLRMDSRNGRRFISARRTLSHAPHGGLATPPNAVAPLLTPLSLESIRHELGDCTRCRLHCGRKHLVFGVGNPNARLMFVGEAPGFDEDRLGEPFVGKAGQLLTR